MPERCNRLVMVATASLKNGDVHGDKLKNGHAKHHPPATKQPDYPGLGTSSPGSQGSDIPSDNEGLFGSFDDGIVDNYDRFFLNGGDGGNVVPHNLLLPNPTSGGGDREQLQRQALVDEAASEFNVGDVTRWPAFTETSWEFNESIAMARGVMSALVAPPWRVMLLSDGSVTRHLQLLADAKARGQPLSSLFPFSWYHKSLQQDFGNPSWQSFASLQWCDYKWDGGRHAESVCVYSPSHEVKVDVLRHHVVAPSDIMNDPSVPKDVLQKLMPHLFAGRGANTEQSFPVVSAAIQKENGEEGEDHATPASCRLSQVEFMVDGLWFMVYGLWFMVYGLSMVYGLWFMVYQWFMVYGLWFMVKVH